MHRVIKIVHVLPLTNNGLRLVVERAGALCPGFFIMFSFMQKNAWPEGQAVQGSSPGW